MIYFLVDLSINWPSLVPVLPIRRNAFHQSKKKENYSSSSLAFYELHNSVVFNKLQPDQISKEGCPGLPEEYLYF